MSDWRHSDFLVPFLSQTVKVQADDRSREDWMQTEGDYL